LQKNAKPSVEEATEFILSLFSKLFDDDSSLSATDDMITSSVCTFQQDIVITLNTISFKIKK
jgi:hypothetical protein